MKKTEIKQINGFLNDVFEGICEGDGKITMAGQEKRFLTQICERVHLVENGFWVLGMILHKFLGVGVFTCGNGGGLVEERGDEKVGL